MLTVDSMPRDCQTLCCWLLLPIQKMKEKTEKLLKPWHVGTHLKILNASYPMNTNTTEFGLSVRVLRRKVASAMEGLILSLFLINIHFSSIDGTH